MAEDDISRFDLDMGMNATEPIYLNSFWLALIPFCSDFVWLLLVVLDVGVILLEFEIGRNVYAESPGPPIRYWLLKETRLVEAVRFLIILKKLLFLIIIFILLIALLVLKTFF